MRELIINGTREIVERYNVDGVHWDDYFYPAEDGSFDDSASYEAYREQGGALSLIEWRTDNINRLVRGVYNAVKSARSDCVFVYPFWNDKAILEIELSDPEEEIRFPSMLKIIREVTDDDSYKNASLARRTSD